jgi:hypothetical protein
MATEPSYIVNRREYQPRRDVKNMDRDVLLGGKIKG